MSSFSVYSSIKAVEKREIDHLGLQLSPYSGQRIDKMINIGVERMTINRVVENQAMINLAEENVKRLLEYITEHAVDCGSFPFMEDLAFDLAMSECYPLWPYI